MGTGGVSPHGAALSRRALCALAAGAATMVATNTLAQAKGSKSNGSSALEDAVTQAGELLSKRAAVSSLTLKQKVAQLFVVKPEAVKGSGVSLWVDDELWKLLVELPVGGVMLKDVNFVSPEQVRELTDGLQQCSRQGCGLPMFISADEEGGTVVRIADKAAFGVDDPGNMRTVGNKGDVDFAESEARRVGTYMRDLGLNLDFAPVSDITDDESSFVYWRSFGGDPELVADMVAAEVRGFNAAGTLCTPKHFPGIGDARGDSHIESIFLDKSLDEMRKRELVPFVAAIEAGAPMIMVSHMTCNAVDATRPASMSPAVVNELLRKELGFEGVVITDGLNMAAVDELYDASELGVQALEAGCDLLLSPDDWRTCYEGILDAVKRGRLSEERIDESVARIMRLKERLG